MSKTDVLSAKKSSIDPKKDKELQSLESASQVSIPMSEPRDYQADELQ